jgi:outer membrane protein OmpA-like peptidoglycan-associated protein
MPTPRIVITPNEFSPSGDTAPVLKVLFNFDSVGDAMVDCRARLVVYDRALYFATALGKAEGLDPFTKDGQNVQPNLGAGPDPANPPLGVGTGVLAVVEGVIRRTKGRKGTYGWCFRPTTTTTNTDGVKLSIIGESLDDYGNFVPAFTMSYLKDDLAGDLMRYLVFRMINLGKTFGAAGSGDVIACNINRKHNRAATPVTFHVAAQNASGGGAIGEDPAASDIKPPEAAERKLPSDLTGLYEAYPYDDQGKETTDFSFDPPLMVHINQAGNALVGWFAPPATNNGAKQGTPPAIFPTAAGCFISCAAPGPNGRLCEWFLDPNGGNAARNTIDPDLRPPATKMMTLKIEDGPKDDVAIGITMTFDDQLTSGGPPQSATIRLRRTGLGTRTPYYCLRPYLIDPDHQPDPQQVEFAREVAQDQIEVLPMTFWDRMAGTVATKLLTAVQEWSDAGGQTSSKLRARGDASNVLVSLVPPPTDPKEEGARYRVVSGKVRALLANIDLEVSSLSIQAPQITTTETESALEWLQLMVDDRITEVMKAQPTLTAADVWGRDGDYTNIEKGFKTLQITPSGDFVYRFDFLTVGGALPAIAFIGGYAFMLTIKKDKITKDKNGTETRVTDISEGWANSNHVLFEGAIAQAGAGAAFDFKKLKGKSKGLSDVPGELEFRTCVDIKSVNDFHGAMFSVNAAKVGSASVVFAKGSIVNTAFVQFTLASGVVLDTTVDASMSFKLGFDWDKVKDAVLKKAPRSVNDAKDLAKDLTIPEVTLVSYIWSGGKILLQAASLGKAATIADDVVSKRTEARQSRTTLFEVDSATLDLANRGWIEAQLAIDRTLFEVAGGSGTAEGYASPEATPGHNQKLTEMRAKAVVQAVTDAFGSTSVITIKPDGKGEGPATDKKIGNLIDPPDPPATPASLSKSDQILLNWERIHEWRLWRKVELTVRGLLVLRIMGRGAKAD